GTRWRVWRSTRRRSRSESTPSASGSRSSSATRCTASTRHCEKHATCCCRYRCTDGRTRSTSASRSVSPCTVYKPGRTAEWGGSGRTAWTGRAARGSRFAVSGIAAVLRGAHPNPASGPFQPQQPLVLNADDASKISGLVLFVVCGVPGLGLLALGIVGLLGNPDDPTGLIIGSCI